MTARTGGGHRQSRDCERRALTLVELHRELDELVANGVLEIVTDPDGTERYQRSEPT